MAVYKSKTALGQTPVQSLLSGLVAGLLYEYTTGTTALVANDIIDMGPLEANVRPMDVTLVTDDLDTNGTPTLTLTVGILNAAGTDIDAAATSTWIAASNVGQTGGIARATTAQAFIGGASTAVRKIGIKVVAGPATHAPAKKLALIVSAVG